MWFLFEMFYIMGLIFKKLFINLKVLFGDRVEELVGKFRG